MIKIENVTKTYKKDDKVVHAISDISITASKGEFVVVKGPSGCGKTTVTAQGTQFEGFYYIRKLER